MKNYDWNKEKIISVIKDCDSFSQLLLKLGIPRRGNNIYTLKKKLEEFNIDYSHFTYGNKSKQWENYVPAKEYLGTDKFITANKLKKKLLKEGIKENKCENPNCPCNDGYWLGNVITYQLHHINGISTDNRLENLQILCPNCHSQTENYCGNANKRKIYYCENCGKEKKSKSSVYCLNCYMKLKRTKRPQKEELIQKFNELKSFNNVSKFYDVSDTSIRKWCKYYKIPTNINDIININKMDV